MWLRFLCLTCGINEAPPTEVDGKSPQRALAQGTSGSPPASTSCPALETCDTEAAATTALPPATLATLTPPYVRRHQRTITLDGSEGSFISVGVPAADCFGNEAADPARSDGGAGSPSHASALAAGAAAAGGTARMSRNSPALPGHHGHRRGAVTAGGGLVSGGGGGGGATCSAPSWARRPGSAKALAYGSGGGAATASASTPAVPSRFSLNGAAPVSRGAYGYTGVPTTTTTTTTTADCGSLSTGSMCGGVGCGGGYNGRTAGGGVTDDGCAPSQQSQLQRPSGGGGGRLHRRYHAPATSGTDPAADAAAVATAGDSAAAGTAVRLAGWPGSADAAAQGAAAASSFLQQAATAAACRHVAKAHANADAADAGAVADASSAHQAVAAAAAAVAAVEAGGDTTANEADAEDNSSIDSAATVVLVEREAEAGGAAATAGEFGMGPTTQLPWGPNAAQRTLLPAHPHQQLLRYAPLPPLQGPRFLLPLAAGPAAAASSVRPWRSCKDSDATASAPASGAQQPQPTSGTGGERGAATAVVGPATESAKAEVVATVDYKEQPWEQDRAAALQQQCRELLQQFPPPLSFAPSSSKLLMKEACPPRRTVTGSSFGSCNNSISLRVDLSGNGGLGILVGDRDDDGGGGCGGDHGVAEGGAAACGSAPHGVVFATRMGAAVVA